jgi:flagellar basal-body rod modification protein FlgD
MAAAAGLFNHAMTAGQVLTPLDSSSSSGSSTSSSSSIGASSGSATISANDFLQLLVTEMQNQDPTDETDPNEYIDQLVDVNSLEQLISINQTLTGAFGTPSTGSGGDAASAQTAGASSASPSAGSPSSAPLGRAIAPAPASIRGAMGALPSAGAQTSAAAQSPSRGSGNLTMPAAIPAAQRVAHALDGSAGGRPRSKPLGGKLAGFEQTSLNNRP